MVRILQIVGTMDRAGAETMVMNLYRAIDRKKYQFDFLYFTNKKCDFDKEIESMGGKIFRIIENNPISRMLKTISLLKENSQWKTVHCHTLFSNAFHIYAAYVAGIKQRIAHSHNTSDQSKNRYIARIYQKFSRIVQQQYSTHFVACGIAAGKFLFPLKNEVLVIPNSIDVQKFAESSNLNNDYLRNEFNLSSTTKIIIQLGRLNKVKNHVFSLSIIKKLRNDHAHFKYFIIGQGDLQNEILDEVKREDLEDVVVFLGLRTDISELLASADLMLMPSLHEGFPVVLVESQAAGLSALISDTISKEVDLGVGLIHFESLSSSIESWIEKMNCIMNISDKISENDRVKKLKYKGFDIYENAKLLEKLYSN